MLVCPRLTPHGGVAARCLRPDRSSHLVGVHGDEFASGGRQDSEGLLALPEGRVGEGRGKLAFDPERNARSRHRINLVGGRAVSESVECVPGRIGHGAGRLRGERSRHDQDERQGAGIMK